MRVDYAFLCDHATGNEKTNALGIGISLIQSESLPFDTDFYLVARILVDRSEYDPNKSIELVVALIDPDGGASGMIQGRLRPPKSLLQNQESVNASVVLHIELSIQEYGRHAISIVGDDSELKRIPFEVKPSLSVTEVV
ncbi:MAG: hypothetical protein OXP37_00670 [Chloroflexota bacterium]|nr:hypothetical protein [Chloroflexota bacterium]